MGARSMGQFDVRRDRQTPPRDCAAGRGRCRAKRGGGALRASDGIRSRSVTTATSYRLPPPSSSGRLLRVAHGAANVGRCSATRQANSSPGLRSRPGEVASSGARRRRGAASVGRHTQQVGYDRDFMPASLTILVRTAPPARSLRSRATSPAELGRSRTWHHDRRPPSANAAPGLPQVGGPEAAMRVFSNDSIEVAQRRRRRRPASPTTESPATPAPGTAVAPKVTSHWNDVLNHWLPMFLL